MRQSHALIALTLASAGIAQPQGRPLDWPFFGGDAQRSSWQRSDLRITKENVKDFELVLKRKLESKGGPRSLTPPVVIGNLISYKGFKELAFVAGASGQIWSVDVDTDRLFWQRQLPTKGSGCAGWTAIPTLTPPTNFAAPRPRPTPAGSASPGAPPSPAATPATAGRPSILGGSGFGAARPAFAVSKDGRLHVLNTSTGEDVSEPIAFLPAKVRPGSLTIADGVLYTAETDCNGKGGGIWSVDLNSDDKKVSSYALKGTAPAGIAGMAIGTTGTIYVSGMNGSVVALAAKSLAEIGSTPGAGQDASRATPVVFSYKEHDMVVAPGPEGRLLLLDPQQMATPVYRSAPVGTVVGGISSWLDADGTRWIAAPIWGPVNSTTKFGIANGSIQNGAIAAFKVEEPNGTPVLTPAWVSRNLISPVPPVITSGIVFALSAGDSAKSGQNAVLYAFDGATGNEMYSTKDQVKEAANLNGMTIANGRVFFTTASGMLYGFGIHLEI